MSYLSWTDDEIKRQTAALREFNRYYFRRMGFLKDAMTEFGFHPSELRVLREIAEMGDGITAACIADRIRMDRAQVSRTLALFRKLGWITETRGPTDGRQRIICLSAEGADTYRRLDQEAESRVSWVLKMTPPRQRERLLAAMGEIRRILRDMRIGPPPTRG